jgi:hypothetical protein
MRVGIIGTAVISHKHSKVYLNFGYSLVACAVNDPMRARKYVDQYGCEPVDCWRGLCLRSDVDFVDVCTLLDFSVRRARRSFASADGMVSPEIRTRGPTPAASDRVEPDAERAPR